MPANILKTITFTLGIGLAGGQAVSDVPQIVTDIAPIHSLVSAVMVGVATPELLLSQGGSPHDFALKPSQAQALSNAKLVVWVGPSLTPALEHGLETLAGTATVLDLMSLEGVHLLPAREAETLGEESHDHDHDHDHGDDAMDPHVWLDPDNANALILALQSELAKIDPDNATRYAANAELALDRIAQARQTAQSLLSAHKDAQLAVYHDAFQYYEHAFGLNVLGAVSASDASEAGPRHLHDLQHRFEENPPACVLMEPGARAKLLDAVVGQSVPTAPLDPLGADLPLGADMYPALIESLAQAIDACLSPKG